MQIKNSCKNVLFFAHNEIIRSPYLHSPEKTEKTQIYEHARN